MSSIRSYIKLPTDLQNIIIEYQRTTYKRCYICTKVTPDFTELFCCSQYLCDQCNFDRHKCPNCRTSGNQPFKSFYKIYFVVYLLNAFLSIGDMIYLLNSIKTLDKEEIDNNIMSAWIDDFLTGIIGNMLLMRSHYESERNLYPHGPSHIILMILRIYFYPIYFGKFFFCNMVIYFLSFMPRFFKGNCICDKTKYVSERLLDDRLIEDLSEELLRVEVN